MPLADWWTEGVASGWGGSRHMRGLWNEKADSFAKAGAVGGWSRHKITKGGLRAHWKHMQARASGNGVGQGKGLGGVVGRLLGIPTYGPKGGFREVEGDSGGGS